jgi:hypothetical protein
MALLRRKRLVRFYTQEATFSERRAGEILTQSGRRAQRSKCPFESSDLELFGPAFRGRERLKSPPLRASEGLNGCRFGPGQSSQNISITGTKGTMDHRHRESRLAWAERPSQRFRQSALSIHDSSERDLNELLREGEP